MTASASRTVLGSVDAITPDSLVLHTDSGRVALPRGQLQRVDVDMGPEHKWAQGWLVGAIAGGTLSGVVGGLAYVYGCGPESDGVCISSADQIFLLSGIGALLAASIGALLGSAVVGPHWRRTRSVATTRVSVLGVPVSWRRLGVVARIEF